jgi:hypothetical protein
MPFTKTGGVIIPRCTYIPQYCLNILTAFGDKVDLTVAEVIRSLGRENINLKDFTFERCLTIKHPMLDGNDQLRIQVIWVLADYLQGIGYIQDCPILYDYRVDPVLTADELLDRMLAARMPKFTASELGGEWGTIDHLMMYFSQVLRQQALILQERPKMADRFRRWLGDIGFKVMMNTGPLSQAERSFLTVYCCTQHGFKGYIGGLPSVPIPAVETKEALVIEVGALAVATCLPGPSMSHLKLLSNGILKELFYYYGHHTAELKAGIGFKEMIGPFFNYAMQPTDVIPWSAENQLVGLTTTSANFLVQSPDSPPFTLKVPFGRRMQNAFGTLCLYPDDPTYTMSLTVAEDISKFVWAYPSKWQGVMVSSLTAGGSMDYALADKAASEKSAGGSQIELTDFLSVGLAYFTSNASKKIIDVTQGIFEEFVLPGPTGQLTVVLIDVSAHYARFGNTLMIPMFSEFLELTQSWFLTPDPRIVDYVATYRGLSLEQRVRFTSIIELCHNCAVYKRVTQEQELPFNRDQYITAMMNEPEGSIVYPKKQ